MDVEHTGLEQLGQVADEVPTRVENEVLRPIGAFISVRFGQVATNRYMQEGPPPNEHGRFPPRSPLDTGPLRKLTERLAQAYRASFKAGVRESETEVLVDGSMGQLRWRKIISVPYAALHEFGGEFSFTLDITDKMRGFFYAKAKETGINEFNTWWRMFLASQTQSSFQISGSVPARPVATPTIRDMETEVAERGGRLVNTLVDAL
jgi:hypothetical protein